MEMVKLTPTQRLETLLALPDLATSHLYIRECLDRYTEFLVTTHKSEEDLQLEFGDKKTAEGLLEKARECGDALFNGLRSIGEGNDFYRSLVV